MGVDPHNFDDTPNQSRKRSAPKDLIPNTPPSWKPLLGSPHSYSANGNFSRQNIFLINKSKHWLDGWQVMKTSVFTDLTVLTTLTESLHKHITRWDFTNLVWTTFIHRANKYYI